MKTLLCALVLPVVACFASPIQDIPFQTMDGKTATLADYAGKVVLVVNVASRCGNTPQYAQLEEIQEFCTSKYKVTFPLFDKIHVKGAEQHPLYLAMTGPDAKFPGDVKWNFGKFLIGKDGTVIARVEPGTKPEDPTVVSAIESALK